MISSISGSGEASKPHMAWWASASALQASVGGIVGIAGLILAIKRDGIVGTLSCLSWLPKRKTISEEDYTVPGLHNYANNCFLNVVLQALASSCYFRPFLEDIVEKSEKMAPGEIYEVLSLTEALAALLRGLQLLSEDKEVLDPSKVMKEISTYTPNFSYVVQQDANEALGLLIDTLREESLRCYVPIQCPLAIPATSTGRILSPQVAKQSEKERWQKHFLGPFDGIAGSILTCQTCSSQLSLDFEFFYALILQPVPTRGTRIVGRCTLFDCFRKFVAQQENRGRCSRCWHSAAASYLSVSKNTGDLEKVESCTLGGSCECESLAGLRNFPWHDILCKIVGRTRIARAPEILSLQLARAIADVPGFPYKLKGHVSFPLLLDLSPYMLTAFGINMHGNVQQQQVKLHSDHRSMPEHSSSSVSDDKMTQTLKKNSEGGLFYRLVCVVEHTGDLDNGHYTVFRNVRSDLPDRWFRISDAEVEKVTEADVLAAEACMLVYERIPDEES